MLIPNSIKIIVRNNSLVFNSLFIFCVFSVPLKSKLCLHSGNAVTPVVQTTSIELSCVAPHFTWVYLCMFPCMWRRILHVLYHRLVTSLVCHITSRYITGLSHHRLVTSLVCHITGSLHHWFVTSPLVTSPARYITGLSHHRLVTSLVCHITSRYITGLSHHRIDASPTHRISPTYNITGSLHPRHTVTFTIPNKV